MKIKGKSGSILCWIIVWTKYDTEEASIPGYSNTLLEYGEESVRDEILNRDMLYTRTKQGQ